MIRGSAGRRRIVGHVCIPGIRNAPRGRDGSHFPISGRKRDALQYLHTVPGPVPCTLVRRAERVPTDCTDGSQSQSTGPNPAERAKPVVWPEPANVAEAPQPQGVEADATGCQSGGQSAVSQPARGTQSGVGGTPGSEASRPPCRPCLDVPEPFAVPCPPPRLPHRRPVPTAPYALS